MKILRLFNSLITPAVANKYVDQVTAKNYFNLTHGTKGVTTWMWYAGVYAKHFDSSAESLHFTGDNYNLTPIFKGGKQLKDKKNNLCYNIVIDNDLTHTNDIILLWTIPARTYSDVSHSTSGSVDTIGLGSYGKSRGDNSTSYPAPVLEIYGDCVLTWTGKTNNGKKVKQVITYNYGTESWNIGSVATVESADV